MARRAAPSDACSMSLPLNPLEVLLELQRAGGLQPAASRLATSSSALSKRISQLEQQLGQALVEHGSKPLRLTEAGRAYAEAARLMREQLRSAEEQSAALQRQVGGSLRLTCSYLLGHAVLADYLVVLRRRYPQLAVDVVLSDEDLDPVAENFDIALRHEPASASEGSGTLIGRALGSNRVRLCGTPDYFARQGLPRHPNELAQHHCLVFRCEPLDGRWSFARGSEQVCVTPRGLLSANSDELLMSALHAGEGLLPCFDWVVAGELAAGRLRACLDDWQFSSPAFGAAELWAIYPRGKRGRPKIQLFIDGLIEHLRGLTAGRRSWLPPASAVGG